MAAADKSATIQYTTMHVTPVIFKITSATQNDSFTVGAYKGVWPLPASITGTNATNAAVTWTYGDCVNNGGNTATDTSIVIASATNPATRVVPYYLAQDTGEIMEVIADSAPTAAASTLTVRRGALGTTAAAITTAHHAAILNQIVMTSATVGGQLIAVLPMPNDDGTKCFSG
jgi:hypothetical protein